MFSKKRCVFICLIYFLIPSPYGALAEGPLSAIDWLSQSITAPPGQRAVRTTPARPLPQTLTTTPFLKKPIDEPEITKDATPGKIVVSVIGANSLDRAGTITAEQIGLPRRLWGLTPTVDIAALINAQPNYNLPALQELMIDLMLVKADPPFDSEQEGTLFLARFDKLLDMGAIDQAQLLGAEVSNQIPDIFRRLFDISLLTGNENAACLVMQSSPYLAPTLPARIFCLARAGDWQAAALTLGTSIALGQVNPADEELLVRFLDPEIAEGADPLPPPQTPTPLIWRMYEAIGEPLPTSDLPLAFSHAELRIQAGWKAQLEASERLARNQAIAPDVLHKIYMARRPAASGDLWARVGAFQKFDGALERGNRQDIEKTLPVVWEKMQSAGLEVPFAALYGDRLIALSQQHDLGPLAFHIALLSPNYEKAAHVWEKKPLSPDDLFLARLALGTLQGTPAPNEMAGMIASAFTAPRISDNLQIMLDEKRIGEALLIGMERLSHAGEGDPRAAQEGLSLLRQIGLEKTARKAAIQLLLLPSPLKQ